MKRWWNALLEQQREADFEALSGATGSLVVPISDRLITDIAAHYLPPSIREMEIRAATGNQLTVVLRLRKPAWLPRITVKLKIDGQPRFPDQPVLTLRLVSHATVAALAGPAVRFLSAFPSWLELDGEMLRVDIAALLRQSGAEDALAYIRRVEVTTRKGSIVAALDVKVP